MEHYGIILHSVKEVIDDTPMGKFARMVLAFVAEMEREKILDRTTTGKINKAKEGKVVSGNKALYGWKWVHNDKGERDYLVLDEEQAEVLRQAGHEYADGVSLRQILKRLKADNVPGPGGGRWYPRTLRHTLTDPRMTGKNVQIFTNHNKSAKQHLKPVDLPDGTYPQKRNFLHMLGATVLIEKQAYVGAEPAWDIRVALPKVQEVIYQGKDGDAFANFFPRAQEIMYRGKGAAFGNSLSIHMNGRASLPRFS